MRQTAFYCSKEGIVDLALIAVAVNLVFLPFWVTGITSQADMLIGIYRIFELDHALTNGVLYPRLGSNFNFGYSAPFLQFYPPLATYIGILFRYLGLGWVEASKAVFVLSLLFGVIGVYSYVRWLTQNRGAALFSAATLLFAPYTVLLIYERGAAAELLSLGFVPWLFYFLHRYLIEGNTTYLAATPLLIAGLMLSHNITALFVMPLLTLFVIMLGWRLGERRQSLLAITAMALGLGMAAFYWLPALGELRYVRTEQYMLTGGDTIWRNLAEGTSFVQAGTQFDYWNANLAKMGLWQLVVLSISAVVLPFWGKYRLVYSFFILLGVLSLFMLTRYSEPVWQQVPLIDFIRFPWRLVGMLSFSVAVLSGGLFHVYESRSRASRVPVVAFVLFMAYYSVAGLILTTSPRWYPLTNEQIDRRSMMEFGRKGFELFTDYEPIWLGLKNSGLTDPRPAEAALFPAIELIPQIEITAESLWRIDMSVNADAPFALRLHRTYFPGWSARVDDREINVSPSGEAGIVTVDLPSGTYQTTLAFGQTTVRQISDTLSVVAVLAFLAWLIWRDRNLTKARLKIALTIGTVLLGLLLVYSPTISRQAATRYPMTRQMNFANEIQLLGFYIDTSEWKPGKTVPVRLYWFANKTPTKNYSVFLHLVDSFDTMKFAQYDGQPIDGYSPTTRWEPGEIVIDEYLLTLPVDLPHGNYHLLVGLYEPDSGVNAEIITGASVLSGNRAVLTDVVIEGQR